MVIGHWSLVIGYWLFLGVPGEPEILLPPRRGVMDDSMRWRRACHTLPSTRSAPNNTADVNQEELAALVGVG
jgi:hypothetical protein